ncbi:MAG: SRPBCC family protein [Acetobacteraceae bacterium]
MNISEQTRLPAPLSEVWPLLSDPALVASCIPGAQLAPDQGDGMWRGSIRVRFGPTVATFRGEATLDYDHAAHRCSIQGRGIDQRGASRGLSSGVIVATAEDDETLLTVDGSFTVTGPLENFANAGGVHVARALLAEFTANMANLVAERHGAVPPRADDAAPPALRPVPLEVASATRSAAPLREPARELNAIGLLWRILTSWLQALFRGRTH